MARLDSFRTSRWLRTFNLVLQALLFFTFFAGLNYLARNHPLRFDLTAHRRYSLSPETLAWVQNLPSPVRIVATFPSDGDNPLVSGLLSEYAHATESNPNGRITVEYLDVDLNRRKAEELGVDQPNAIVLLCRDRREVLTVDSLYALKEQKRAAFQGEQKLTSAILDVSNPERQKIYFLRGHGESKPEDPDPRKGLSAVRDKLKDLNFDVIGIDLSIERGVPKDAALVVIVAPQARYTPAEQEILRRYLRDDAGRLIVLLAPGPSAIDLGLDDLFYDWGVLVDNDIVWDTGAENLTDTGDLLIHHFRKGNPIMQGLYDAGLWLRFGLTRSVRPDPGRTTSSGLSTVTLAASSPTAWGDVGVFHGQQPNYANRGNIHPLAGMDPPDALGVIVASERVAPRDNLPVSVRGGRLVVIGTGDLVANNRYAFAGNLPVFIGAVNWMTDHEAQLKIPARPIERYQLSLSAGSLLHLRYTLLLALPGIAAALGLLVYWTRRR